GFGPADAALHLLALHAPKLGPSENNIGFKLGDLTTQLVCASNLVPIACLTGPTVIAPELVPDRRPGPGPIVVFLPGRQLSQVAGAIDLLPHNQPQLGTGEIQVD